jgi:hypothetical protein
MIGASMNCTGVGKKGMSVFLTDFIREQQLDFIGLQETIKKTILKIYSGRLILRINFPGDGSLLLDELVAFSEVSARSGLISWIQCWEDSL